MEIIQVSKIAYLEQRVEIVATKDYLVFRINGADVVKVSWDKVQELENSFDRSKTN